MAGGHQKIQSQAQGTTAIRKDPRSTILNTSYKIGFIQQNEATQMSSELPQQPGLAKASKKRVQIDLRTFLQRQKQLGFHPKYMVSFHYRSPEETGWRGEGQPSAITTASRHKPRASVWNQVNSYNYYDKRRNDIDSVSNDNKHIRSLIVRRHFGLQRLDKLNQQTPLLFFVERGIGTQLHCHLLIPKPLVAFDDVNALSTDWKGHITSHAKCISRQRPPHVLEISDGPEVYIYLTKETCIDHLSLDFMASNFPSASSEKTDANK
jgi:hypothetical protein